MAFLPSPANSVENSPKSSPSTPVISGRKRARSTASSEASSSKRAMSEDPSLSTTDPPHSISSPLSRTGEDETNPYMHSQTEEDAAKVMKSASSPASIEPAIERYELINSWKYRPMVPGEMWYIVSHKWYHNWDKACTGKVDKEGIMLENQLGPVDNSSFFKDGEFDDTCSLIDGVDVDYVPPEAWKLLVQWYGEPTYTIARQVITRGAQNVPQLELHPPYFQAHLLVSELSSDNDSPPSRFTISCKATLADLYQKLASLFNLPPESIFRVWTTDNAADFEGVNVMAQKFTDRGQLFPASSEENSLNKLIQDSLLTSGDKLVVEVCEGNSWLLNESDTRTSDATVDEMELAGPVFNTRNNFFSGLGSGSSSKAEGSSSSTSKRTFPEFSSSTYGKGRSDRKEVVPGTIGFVNMGNTCFMNSALQCLGHQKELVNYFLSGVYKEELNPDNPLGMQGAIAEAFGALLHRVWNSSSSAPYAPREFKMQLQRFAPQFSGYQQHDSQELVAFLLDGLHEDLNRVLNKPYVEKPDWEGGGDKELIELASKSWEGYMKRNDSVIVDLFQGQYKSTLICPECEKVSITFDPFMYLTLPIPVLRKWTHQIFYVPWDLSKPHLKFPVELDRNASFKDVRQLLGRWMVADPDNLLILESFNNNFYKNLDDAVMVGDVAENDVVVCFELPCHAQQSRSWKAHPDSDKNPVIIPVYHVKEMPYTGYRRTDTGFAHPFFVVLDNEQVRDRSKIYAAVVERLERWTRYTEHLYRWESSDEDVSDSTLDTKTSVTEISENGEVSFRDETQEEQDIVDEHPFILEESSVEPTSKSLKRLGPQELFEMRIETGHGIYGVGYRTGQSWNSQDVWETRSKADESDENPRLLFPGDALYCEWNEHTLQYFFGTDPIRFDHSDMRWQVCIHEEYRSLQEASQSRIKRNISLDDCLKEFTKEEMLGEEDLWYCPQCKKHQQATKKFDLWTIPDILVVHLKRFSNNRTLRDKIDAFVDFPIEGLDLESFCAEREVAKRLTSQGEDLSTLPLSSTIDEPAVYDLFAVDEHIGGLGGGHYYAYAKNHLNEKWYHFEDSHVMPAEASDAVNESAYLLFYKRRTDKPLGGKSVEKVNAALKENLEENSLPVTEESTNDVQLPTPPDEDDSIQMKSAMPSHNYPAFDFSNDSSNWNRLRSSPSPAEDDVINNDESPFIDDVPEFTQGMSRNYDYAGPSSSMASPASSNLAELGDADDNFHDLNDSSEDDENSKLPESKLHDIDL